MKGINHWAVLVAAIVFFALGALWYSVLFEHQWLAGIGKTIAELQKEGGGSPRPYIVGFLAIVVMCYTLGWIVQRGMQPTPRNGALTGAVVGFGLIGATLALTYGFEARGITLWLINAGYVVIGLVIAGIIIGAWHKQSRSESQDP
jgi:hypothetical protein